MRYEDAIKLEELASDLYEKKALFDALGTANTPNSPDEAKAQFVRYALAEAQYTEAQRKLEEAQGQIAAYGKLR